jgi:hypothetical protein
MHPFAATLLALTIVAGAGLLWFGNRLERATMLAIGVYLVVTPFAAIIQFDTWRIGVFALEAVLFLIFWAAAEAANRWWLTAAAGFQLISVISFAMPLLLSDMLVLTGILMRLGAWGLVIAAMGFGVFETRLHRQARLA